MEMDREVRRSRIEAMRWIVNVEADLQEVEVIQAAAPGLCRGWGRAREACGCFSGGERKRERQKH